MIKVNNLCKKSLAIVIILLIIAMNTIPSTASRTQVHDGNTLYVGGGGLGNYSNVQEAIDDAENGDTIFVFDDSSPYNENIVIDKSINLFGENRETTIIDGGSSGNVVFILGDCVNISGFTIQNSGNGESDAGIHLWSNDSTISGNIMDNNFYGIYQFHSTRNIIVENDVTNNNNCGIVLIGSTLTSVSDNYVNGQPFNGIGLGQGSEKNTISRNTIINNAYSGIRVISSLDNTILENLLEGNLVGVRLEYSSDNNIIRNTFLESSERKALFFGDSISHRRNTWDENYWERSRLLPKPIFGRMGKLLLLIPLVAFDWHPAKEPYDIP